MLLCPRCVDVLTEARVGELTEFSCHACGGRAETAEVLRRSHTEEEASAFWPAARLTARPDGLHCPSCSDGMGRAELVVDGDRGEVAACGRCQIVWFDGAGAEAPPVPAPVAPKKATSPSRSTAPIDRKPLKAKRIDGDTIEVDLEGTEFFAAAMGFIAKVNAPERLVRPWITWALSTGILALLVVPALEDWSALGFGNIGYTRARWVAEWGFVPAEMFRHGGLTFLTSFMLHGGWFHAFANVYFLALTGEDLEGLLGRARFVALLLASTVLGDLFDTATRVDRTTPSIGASGGISGLMAYYALALPQVKVGIPFMFGGWRSGQVQLVQWRVPVRWMLWFWIGMQLLGALWGSTRIGYAAHLGGALAGIVWWLVERSRAAAAAATAAGNPPR